MLQRWFKTVLVLAAVLAIGGAALTQCGPPPTPTQLVVPGSVAFAVIGHSCGGIQQQVFASGFDTTTGFPVGDAHVQTSCSSGGRGGHSTTYAAWMTTEWDFTGALVSYAALASAPTVNPTFSAFDAHGNEVYNQSNLAFLTLASGFTPAPRVAGVTPNSGPQGSTVTIAGTGFTGATAVDFGVLPAVSFTVNSATSITAVTPALRAATVDVTVRGGGGTSATNGSDQFTFVPTPRVASVSPTQGTADGGTTVTITGVNFTGATAVSFGGATGTFTVHSDTSITVVTPPGPDSGVTVDVVVTSPYGSSATGPSDQFLYT